MEYRNRIIQGDALAVLKTLPDNFVQCVVTSPPYWNLRNYGTEGQVGLEETPEQYIAKLVEVFREVKRVLREDGVCWVNLGDSYSSGFSNPSPNVGTPRKVKGLPPKNLVGIPWRVALALQSDGWILRADVIWHKSNCMPESVKDRPTKSHEYVFLLAKNERYFYDAQSIADPAANVGKVITLGLKSFSKGQASGAGVNPSGNGKADTYTVVANRNKRSVWTINTHPYKEAHFAVMPEKLVEPCVLAGSRPNDIVLDPFSGAGTVALVANKLGRAYLGIELNPAYVELSQLRLAQLPLVPTELQHAA